MALSGIYAFSQPFSIEIIGLHALSGFVFIAVVVGHILNNIVPLKKYFKHGTSLGVGLIVAINPPHSFTTNQHPSRLFLD